MENQATTLVGARVPSELLDRLDNYATKTQRSRAGVVRFALERLLAHEAHEETAAERERLAAAGPRPKRRTQ